MFRSSLRDSISIGGRQPSVETLGYFRLSLRDFHFVASSTILISSGVAAAREQHRVVREDFCWPIPTNRAGKAAG